MRVRNYKSDMAFVKRMQKEIDEALANVKCTLCRKPLGEAIASETLGMMYGKWGVCHKSCVASFEADMYG